MDGRIGAWRVCIGQSRVVAGDSEGGGGGWWRSVLAREHSLTFTRRSCTRPFTARPWRRPVPPPTPKISSEPVSRASPTGAGQKASPLQTLDSTHLPRPRYFTAWPAVVCTSPDAPFSLLLCPDGYVHRCRLALRSPSCAAPNPSRCRPSIPTPRRKMSAIPSSNKRSIDPAPVRTPTGASSLLCLARMRSLSLPLPLSLCLGTRRCACRLPLLPRKR